MGGRKTEKREGKGEWERAGAKIDWGERRGSSGRREGERAEREGGEAKEKRTDEQEKRLRKERTESGGGAREGSEREGRENL